MINTGHSVYVSYVLGQLWRSRELVSVFLDAENPDTFTTGFVLAVNQRQVLMRCVTPWGMLDGYMALRNQDIIQTVYGEDFEKRMTTLLELRGQVPREQVPREELRFDPGADLFAQLLNIGLTTGCVVTLWDDQTSITGRITALDDLRVTMAALDFFGAGADEANVRLRDIQLVSLGSEEEEVYRLLSQAANEGNPQPNGCLS